MSDQRKITASQLQEIVAPWVPGGINPQEVLEGVALALVPSAKRTLPLVSNPFKSDVLYAWSEEDASATKLGLNLLGEIFQALLDEHHRLLSAGMAVKEVVCFLIDLQRHHVRINDPLQIKILFILRDASAGLSAEEIRKRLGTSAPPLAQIEQALDTLALTEARGGPRPLVRSNRMIWKILV